MEEKPRSLSQNALYFGLITGAALVVYSLILYLSGQYMNKTLGYFSFILLVGGMVYGTLDYRKKNMNGFLTYGKAFSSCFLIGLFAGIIAAVYSFVFAQFIYPGYVNEILDKTRESMLSSGGGMTEEQIDTALEYTRKFTSPVMMAVMTLVIYPVFSAILSLIIAIFLKKEDPTLNTNM